MIGYFLANIWDICCDLKNAEKAHFSLRFPPHSKTRYLNECHPREFIVTLHWISEVVLQRPELSVQVVVDWNGTAAEIKIRKVAKQHGHLNKQTNKKVLQFI